MPEFNVHLYQQEDESLPPIMWEKIEAEDELDAIVRSLKRDEDRGVKFNIPICVHVQKGISCWPNGTPMITMKYSIVEDDTESN